MVPELEKPRITEIQVRMDCNGCVQKIKKALHGINGIYDLYIDFPQQKLTIIGWADPEKIVKAIRKTRKIATICSHTEATDQPTDQQQQQQQQQPPDQGGGPPPATNPPAEPPQAAAPTVPQPELEPPKNPPPPENPPTEAATPAPHNTNASSQQPAAAAASPSGPKDVGEVHVIYNHPPPPVEYAYRYGYGGGSYGGGSYGGAQPFPPQPPQPIYVTHSYNTYKPSPYVTEYHEYVHSPPRYAQYSRTAMDHYNNEDSYHSSNNGNSNGNITSIFSDENPNACRIM